MLRLARISAGVVAGLLALYAAWYGSSFASGGIRNNLPLLPIPLVFLTLAACSLWFALGGSRQVQRRRIVVTLSAGVLVGGIALVPGMIVPIILDPTSNQGPLLGVLVTGPLGFILGCLVGAVLARWLVRPA